MKSESLNWIIEQVNTFKGLVHSKTAKENRIDIEEKHRASYLRSMERLQVQNLTSARVL